MMANIIHQYVLSIQSPKRKIILSKMLDKATQQMQILLTSIARKESQENPNLGAIRALEAHVAKYLNLSPISPNQLTFHDNLPQE